jgi:hypothetical protein
MFSSVPFTAFFSTVSGSRRIGKKSLIPTSEFLTTIVAFVGMVFIVLPDGQPTQAGHSRNWFEFAMPFGGDTLEIGEIVVVEVPIFVVHVVSFRDGTNVCLPQCSMV